MFGVDTEGDVGFVAHRGARPQRLELGCLKGREGGYGV